MRVGRILEKIKAPPPSSSGFSVLVLFRRRKSPGDVKTFVFEWSVTPRETWVRAGQLGTLDVKARRFSVESDGTHLSGLRMTHPSRGFHLAVRQTVTVK